MRARTLLWIDRVAGYPLLALANLAARAAGALGGRNHDADPGQVRCIVVAKFLGLGSIIQATPMLGALRQKFPRARLLFVTASANASMVRRLGLVDEVVEVDAGLPLRLAASAARAWARVARARPDLYFDLEVYSALACLFALSSLARNRLGFFRHHAVLKRGAHTHLLYFNTRRPVSRLYLQLGALAGATPGTESGLVAPRVDDGERRRVRELLRERLGAGANEYIVLNPNASDLLVERRWPVESFRALARALAQRGERLVVIGSAGERDWAARVAAAVGEGQAWNSAGELSLGELGALLGEARLVVTNDTGPMHLAAALGAPMVCLFGPCDPAHYGLDGPRVETIHKAIHCSPCVHETDRPPCAGDNQCMKRISVDEVLAACLRVMAGEARPGASRAPEALDLAGGAGASIDGLDREESVSAAGEPPCVCCGARVLLPQGRWKDHLLQRCTGCASERLSPPPTDERLAEIYGEDYYAAWGDTGDGATAAADEMKRAFFRASLQRLGPAREGSRLLDCGAAFGALMEEARALGHEPFGVELNPRGARVIASRLGADRVFEGHFEEARFDGEPEFDVVAMFDFIEHVRDPGAVLAKARAMMAPGGRLVICTPNPATMGRRLMGRRWLHLKEEHLNYFTPAGMRRLLARSGLAVESLGPARKVMTLDYLHTQLTRYPHPLLTPVAGAAARVASPALRARHFPARFGEMLVVARRG